MTLREAAKQENVDGRDTGKKHHISETYYRQQRIYGCDDKDMFGLVDKLIFSDKSMICESGAEVMGSNPLQA